MAAVEKCFTNIAKDGTTVVFLSYDGKNYKRVFKKSGTEPADFFLPEDLENPLTGVERTTFPIDGDIVYVLQSSDKIVDDLDNEYWLILADEYTETSGLVGVHPSGRRP